jgi:class 3 adenylate cyclase
MSRARRQLYAGLTVERAAWTDERLDDLAEAMRAGFERVDRDIRDLRAEMRGEFTALRAEMDALRQTMLRIGAGLLGGMAFGFLSVIAAILARGG